MKRRQFSLLAAVSLLVCAATVVLWVRSVHTFDRVQHQTDIGRAFGLQTYPGGLEWHQRPWWFAHIWMTRGWMPGPAGWSFESFRWDQGQTMPKFSSHLAMLMSGGVPGSPVPAVASQKPESMTLTKTPAAYSFSLSFGGTPASLPSALPRVASFGFATSQPTSISLSGVDSLNLSPPNIYSLPGKSIGSLNSSAIRGYSSMGNGISVGVGQVLTFAISAQWDPPVHRLLGFGYEVDQSAAASGLFSADGWPIRVTMPFWFLVILFLIAPMIWVRNRRRLGYRARNQLCLACGYDLRATPGRCPECGVERTGAFSARL